MKNLPSQSAADHIQESPEGIYDHRGNFFASIEVTILLADLRGFTSLTASLPAKTMIILLNRFLG